MSDELTVHFTSLSISVGYEKSSHTQQDTWLNNAVKHRKSQTPRGGLAPRVLENAEEWQTPIDQIPAHLSLVSRPSVLAEEVSLEVLDAFEGGSAVEKTCAEQITTNNKSKPVHSRSTIQQHAPIGQCNVNMK